MNELSLFSFGPHQVRELERGGEPWFVAKDVIQILGVGNITEALRGLQEDERCSVVLNTPGGKQEMAMVSEPGLYRLVFRSRKPEAEKFKRWIAHEVLPQIRRDGVYVLEQEVAELKDRALSYSEWYFLARKECKALEERYRLSHTHLSEFEKVRIKVLLRQDKATGEVAEQSGRSIRTVQRIKKEAVL